MPKDNAKKTILQQIMQKNNKIFHQKKEKNKNKKNAFKCEWV
jgi:hypothetical protein